MAWVRFPDGTRKKVERVEKADARCDLHELTSLSAVGAAPCFRNVERATFDKIIDEWFARPDFLTRPPSVAGTMGEISTFEEKGSDVNLAVWAMADAYEGRAPCSVIVSGDSDFVELAHLLRARGSHVGVIIPESGQRVNTIPRDFTKALRNTDFARCQLPNPVVTGTGQQIHRPPVWA